MPLLFLRRIGLENRPIPGGGIRDLIARALASSGITGTGGEPLHIPHGAGQAGDGPFRLSRHWINRSRQGAEQPLPLPVD